MAIDVNVPRLQRELVLVNKDGTPTLAYHQLWEQLAKIIEKLAEEV